jgi:tRNA-uridine 2-sulfurtransferase
VKDRVLVAMSGGVDSAVAAARLVSDGYDVVGITLHLWDYPEGEGPGSHGRCCAPEDQYDARRTADALGFPHYTFDRRALFAKTVVTPFVDAYLAGETPSPCASCNRGVKLRELFSLADKLGAAYVATGHYARVVTDEGGAVFLAEGRDLDKDQSYFLYATAERDLRRLLFPLGESLKGEVRAEALARGLPGAGKGESQELCFVGDKPHAYAAFVEERARGRVSRGAFVDEDGRQLGTHDGIHRFTVGQRKGVGVAAGRPLYVTRVDAATGRVHLGGEDSLLSRVAVVEDVTLAPRVELPRRARVRVRYRHAGEMAELGAHTPAAGNARAIVARFDEPIRAIARGQVAVFYDGPRVLGGGKLSGVAPS